MRPPAPVLPAPENPLLTEALALAHWICSQSHLPSFPEWSREDFHQLARIVAWTALQSYNPARGCKWQTWVVQKIRWALSQQKRALLPHGRRMQARHDAREAEIRAARIAGQEPPPPIRLPVRPLSLQDVLPSEDGDEESDRPTLPEGSTAFSCPFGEETLLVRLELTEALARLPTRLRQVMRFRLAGHTEAEIARMLKVAPSRAHQLCLAARDQMRGFLELSAPTPRRRS